VAADLRLAEIIAKHKSIGAAFEKAPQTLEGQDSVLGELAESLIRDGKFGLAGKAAQLMEDMEYRAEVCTKVAVAARERGDTERYEKSIAEAMISAEKEDDLELRAVYYADMADALISIGDLTKGEKTLRLAISAARQAKDGLFLKTDSGHVTILLLRLGKREEAERFAAGAREESKPSIAAAYTEYFATYGTKEQLNAHLRSLKTPAERAMAYMWVARAIERRQKSKGDGRKKGKPAEAG